MKFKTSQKTIKNNYYHILSIGYCDAWYLLYFQNPIAYNSGVYGWNCDYYDINNVCICMGYRPHGKHIDYDVIRAYNEKAKNAIETIRDYDEKKTIVNNYLMEFINEVTK